MQGKSETRLISHLRTVKVHLEKPSSSCTSPGAKAVLLCSGCHQCSNPPWATSCLLCPILPVVSDHSLSLLHPFMKHSQCWFPMVHPCLDLLPIPCQPQHSGDSICLSSSLPASILSLPSTSHLPVCLGIRLTFAVLNSASTIHPLPSRLVNSSAPPAPASRQEGSPSSCSASRAVPARRCLANASLLQ